jgi:hypothetical protein
MHAEAAPAAGSSGTGALGLADGVDALHYTLDLRFDSAARTVSGRVLSRFEVLTPGLSELGLDLYDNMAVSSVLVGGRDHPFVQGGNVLTIDLRRPHAAGEVVEVEVAYAGSPRNVGLGSFYWGTRGGKPAFSSLSEPTYGATWWPSVDDPADKVTAEMIFTVEPGLVAVSNGVLLSATAQPDGWVTYHWSEAYPIAPYLISIACGDYVAFSDAYTPLGGGPTMEIRYWVYPDLLDEAQVSFAPTPAMIAGFASLFGEYPFLAEKYAMATWRQGGAMEHQTATSYGAGWVTGDDSYEWVIAHELAHQWWGDSVTLSDWRETWLHEGFATYSEALWFEREHGAAYYHQYVDSLDPGDFLGPVHGNPSPFGLTVYNKGAWVLHMLRRVVGDAVFFDILRAYHDAHLYGNATTEDLRAAAEAVHGADLSWFFQEWVYGEGRPAYVWGWTEAWTGSRHVVHLRIDQGQGGVPYRMPIDVRIETAAGPVETTVWADGSARDFAIPVPAPATAVALDPDNWILDAQIQVELADADADGVPDTGDLCPSVADPAQADADLDGAGDACDPDADGDAVLNGDDCAPLDAASHAPPAEVGALSWAGTALVWSDLSAQAGAGIRYDLVLGDPIEAAGGGSLGGAECLASGEEATTLVEASAPPPGGGFYYLVRARNACGRGSYGTGSGGEVRLAGACPADAPGGGSGRDRPVLRPPEETVAPPPE